MNQVSESKFLFHPILTHFPIAFLTLELFLLILWVVKKEDFFRRAGFLIFRLAYVCLPVTMIAGYVDANGITSMVKKHFISALATFIFCSFRGILWLKMSRSQAWKPEWITISAAGGVILMMVTGYLGGLLVYG